MALLACILPRHLFRKSFLVDKRHPTGESDLVFFHLNCVVPDFDEPIEAKSAKFSQIIIKIVELHLVLFVLTYFISIQENSSLSCTYIKYIYT